MLEKILSRKLFSRSLYPDGSPLHRHQIIPSANMVGGNDSAKSAAGHPSASMAGGKTTVQGMRWDIHLRAWQGEIQVQGVQGMPSSEL